MSIGISQYKISFILSQSKIGLHWILHYMEKWHMRKILLAASQLAKYFCIFFIRDTTKDSLEIHCLREWISGYQTRSQISKNRNLSLEMYITVTRYKSDMICAYISLTSTVVGIKLNKFKHINLWLVELMMMNKNTTYFDWKHIHVLKLMSNNNILL